MAARSAGNGNLETVGLSRGRKQAGEDYGEPCRAIWQNFDLTQEINILRLICGLFFIPHIYAKFFVPEALGFFKAAKFNPPAVWMYTACVIETFLAIGLIFAILPFYAGVIGLLSSALRRLGGWTR